MKKKFIEVDGKKIFLDDVKVQEEPGTETPAPETPTPTPETPAEDVEAMAKAMAEKIVAQIVEAQTKISKDNEEKMSKMTPKITVEEGEILIRKTKAGKELTLKRSDAESVGSILKALVKRDYTTVGRVMQKLEPLNEGTNQEGGFLVPTVWSNILVPIIEDVSVVRGLATVLNMTSAQLNISVEATKPQMSWGAENTNKSTTSMTFAQVTLTPYKLSGIVTITEELLEDAIFDMVRIITNRMGEAIAMEEDRAFLVGNGTGRPTGIDNYTLPLISAGNALSFDHINAAYWRLPQAYRNKAVWVMNSRTIEAISQLKDSQNRYLLEQNSILTEPGIPSLKGRPVYESNFLPSSSIFFGDFSYYYIGLRKGLTIRTSTDASLSLGGANVSLWQRNLLGILAEERVDGELSLTRSFYEITNTGVS